MPVLQSTARMGDRRRWERPHLLYPLLLPAQDAKSEGEVMSLDPYPTEAELDNIRTWDSSRGPYSGLMAHVKALWWPDHDTGWKQEGQHYEIATCGWSGNEDIIQALQENLVFWGRCWHSHLRGGLYVFELPKKGKGKR